MNYFTFTFVVICIYIAGTSAQTACQPSQGCSVGILITSTVSTRNITCPLSGGFAAAAVSATLGALPASCNVLPSNLFQVYCREEGVLTAIGGTGTGTGTAAETPNYAILETLIMCNSCTQGTLNIPRRIRTSTRTTRRRTQTGTGTGTGASTICPLSLPATRSIVVFGIPYLATIANRGLIGYYCSNTQLIAGGTRNAFCVCPSGCTAN
ncbi:PREDICTED: uncharacterized protein LOC109580720 [Amphimedon queenslandica]|uniref:Uncharacterized protein n=1 Tax=Amphimedon queenslandica TaxID=400682 RepID=A0A1X7VDB9_AMPQE|nr:PREDICTED: uncharacterized protein LOC109580720 [Amphimedon queenslandica]|eukprot:XP_019849766.1 PREDICTED: uncharacterized protein LOC109580720 [Amphimedon queenslandica]